MKKSYVIYFDGLFERGYVCFALRMKTKTIECKSLNESLAMATRFRFKWFATVICSILNNNHDLRTFTIKPITDFNYNNK